MKDQCVCSGDSVIEKEVSPVFLYADSICRNFYLNIVTVLWQSRLCDSHNLVVQEIENLTPSDIAPRKPDSLKKGVTRRWDFWMWDKGDRRFLKINDKRLDVELYVGTVKEVARIRKLIDAVNTPGVVEEPPVDKLVNYLRVLVWKSLIKHIGASSENFDAWVNSMQKLWVAKGREDQIGLFRSARAEFANAMGLVPMPFMPYF